MKIFKNAIILIAVIVLIFIFYYNRTINYSTNSGDEQEFIIESGQGLNKITENLNESDLIKSKFVFKVYAVLSGKQGEFRMGNYLLSPKMNIKEITAELTKPIFLKPEERITFIEGWNLRDYARALENKELFSADDFLALTGEPMIDYRNSQKESPKDYSDEFSFLKDKPKHQGLEGYLFPDTYRFFIDVSLDDVIRRMLSNFDSKLTAKMREDISSQGKTIHEIVTMASIIEKEVRSERDMKMVSGIFWNRMRGSQALESCATLAYILGVNKVQYSFEDTRIPSPYNTYISRGLPPGPIANPGLKAIEAAIYPEQNNYNFFLTNTETGETVFSRTYEEHLINKNKYIK